jgi:hypothetical protein
MRVAIPPLPQYVFMAWCLVKHRDNFTFYDKNILINLIIHAEFLRKDTKIISLCNYRVQQRNERLYL